MYTNGNISILQLFKYHDDLQETVKCFHNVTNGKYIYFPFDPDLYVLRCHRYITVQI